MQLRPGVCAIIWRNGKSGREFLLMHRVMNWTGWELVKGGMQEGEDEKKALLRELKEETGCTRVSNVKRLDYVLQYRWPKPEKRDGKTYEGVQFHLFSAEYKCASVTTGEEHDGFTWAPADRVLKQLTYEDQREAFTFFLNMQ